MQYYFFANDWPVYMPILFVREIDINIVFSNIYCQVGFFNPTFLHSKETTVRLGNLKKNGTVDIFNIILFHQLFVLSTASFTYSIIKIGDFIYFFAYFM